jgi:predicted glycoside hydrolase/deacetylase ChbG (UPF0249 family)
LKRLLIVNADDYGHTPGVSAGIRQAHLEGIVTTTTVMANRPGALDAIRVARQRTPALGLGVHLNLTSGRPCSPPESIPSLVDAEGLFLRPEVHLAQPKGVERDQAEIEWRAQIETFLESGAVLDHLDSHHHIAASRPDVWDLCLDLAREFGCGVRLPVLQEPDPPEALSFFTVNDAMRRLSASGVPHTDTFVDRFYGDQATPENLRSILLSLGPGVTELMTHPAHVDDALLAVSIYAREREPELSLLTSPAVRQILEREGIGLATFRQALATRP